MDTNAIGIALSLQKQINYLSEVVQALSGGIHYRGAVQHYSDLASLTPETGDCYTVLDNGQEYAWGELSSVMQWIPIGIEYESKQPAQGGTDVSLVTTGEKYTWNAKQDALVNQSNIKSVNGTSLLGSGNLAVNTYQAFQSSWNTSGTIAQFCASVNADSSAVKGMAYLGELTCSDLPFNGNADAVAEVIDGTGTSGKVIHVVITSGNVAPYRWEYTYWNNGTNVSGWISFQNELTAGTNIQINGTTISATDTTYGAASTSAAGLMPQLASASVSTQDQTTKFMREDGTWAAPSYSTPGISQSDADNRYLKLDGSTAMTGAIKSDYGIKFSDGTTNMIMPSGATIDVGNANQNTEIWLSTGANQDVYHHKGTSFKVILDAGNTSANPTLSGGETVLGSLKLAGTNYAVPTYTAGTNVQIQNGVISATDTTYTSQSAAQGGTTVSLVTTGEKFIWNAKQDALATQTAYTQKGTATKVPQITTNSLGQVTGITEVDIAKELPTTTGLSDGTYFTKLTMLNGTPTLAWSDAFYDGTVVDNV